MRAYCQVEGKDEGKKVSGGCITRVRLRAERFPDGVLPE